MTNARAHSWRFKTRFRRHAFGWKSQPAVTRLQEALSEIKQVARLEPSLAAEGAIALLERISPALERVDSSSGVIGSAVNRTIAELVPVIAAASADARTRAGWLDRLIEAHAADQIPYIEQLAEYALSANRAATYLGWFRALAKKYPYKPPGVVLADLVRSTPGQEGKWFAVAKDAKLFEEAVALANATPCDPKTLTRAARDFAQTNPEFAVEAGLAALRWLVQGYGYEITSVDVRAAYSHTLTAAANVGVWDAVRPRIRVLFDDPAARTGFVASVIGKEVGLD